MQDILGQDRAIGVLEAVLTSQRVHHAFIFHGPVGVGKFTTAQRFATILLCASPQTDLTGRPRACGQCESCRLMLAGSHPDFHLITKELAAHSSDSDVRNRKQTNIPAQVLREFLIDRVYHKPRLSAGKVVVIDEADLVDDRGQNILLKTLEEPPSGTHLVLVTSNVHRLLPTVRSRCQRIGFGSLPDDLIVSKLNEYDLNASEPQRRWLVQFAAGSPGRLDLAVRFELWSWARQIIAGVDSIQRGHYPVELGDQMQQMLNDFADAWVKAQGPQASKGAANRFAATLLWTMVGQQIQHHLHLTAEQVRDQPPWDAELALEPWLVALDAVRQAEAQVAANVHLAMVTGNLVNLMYRALRPGQTAAAGSAHT